MSRPSGRVWNARGWDMAKAPNYKDAVDYWSSQAATVDGMLGGYGTGRVPRLDIQHSTLFLRQLISAGHLPAAALDVEARGKDSTEEGIRTVDCGAGIGRVTRDLLLHYSTTVDLVEPCPPFTDVILTGEDLRPAREAGRIGEVLTIGLQDFHPPADAYDIIWNQWCLGQLDTPDLVAYLARCKRALRRGGRQSLIFVKENIATAEDVFDEQDSSWTRSEASFLEIFKAAGLVVVKAGLQHGFPKELFRVKLWALR